jgi:hypothetical protein
MFLVFLLLNISLSAQPPGESNSVISVEDIVFLQTTPTAPTEAENNASVADSYTSEQTISVSFANNDKNLASFKSVQNSATIQSARAWNTPQSQPTRGWQAETISVTAYPNPVVDYLQIELMDFDNELQLVELFGANGQLLKTQNTPASPQVQIDMSSLPNGSYYIRTTTLKGTTTLPIAKS